MTPTESKSRPKYLAVMKAFAGAYRCLLGGLFVFAGATKIGDPAAFSFDVEGYRVLTGAWALGLAFFLPWLEIAAGAALIAKRPYRGAVLLAVVMLVGFFAALVQAWARGLDISCGCFGGGDRPAQYPWLVVRDLVMLLAAACCWWDAGRHLQRPTTPRFPPIRS